MQISFMPCRLLIIIGVVSYLTVGDAFGQKAMVSAPAPSQSDLFDVSLGFNYIYLNDQYPETKNLYGVDGSFFVNATSWLALGADFMANFGSHSVPVFFGNTVDVDSQRYIYVFGPRLTVWHNPQFRVFLEALAGGVHAEADFTLNRRFSSTSASASDDGFAMALGGGFDWRFSNHLSWRIVQADYLPTHLGNDWQNNFRASTAIVYSFGRR
jgi:outer membrane protein with beta-barrel domain